jgi:hypothetical protein
MKERGRERSCWTAYVRAVGAVDRNVNHGLGWWGATVAQRPVITLVISLIVAIGLSAGLVLIVDNIESKGDKLWCVSSLLSSFYRAGPDNW